MRGIVVAISMLALGAGVARAEAEDRGEGRDTPVPSPAASAPGLAVMPGLTLRTDGDNSGKPAAVVTAEAVAPGEPGSLKIPMVGPAAPRVPVLKKSEEPWCRSGRIAGSGSGFCLIN